MSLASLPAAKFAVIPGGAPKPSGPEKTGAQRGAAKLAELALKRQIDYWHKLLSRLERDQERYAARIKSLQGRKQQLAQIAEAVEDEILRRMDEAHCERAPGFTVEFRQHPCPPSLEVEDESAVPRDYIREKIVTSVDKVQVKAALQRGEEIGGVRLLQSISLLRTR